MLFNVSIVLFENIINGTSNDTYSRSRLMMFFLHCSLWHELLLQKNVSVYMLALFGYYYILKFFHSIQTKSRKKYRKEALHIKIINQQDIVVLLFILWASGVSLHFIFQIKCQWLSFWTKERNTYYNKYKNQKHALTLILIKQSNSFYLEGFLLFVQT